MSSDKKNDRIYAEIYKDMSLEDLIKYTKEFLDHESDGYIGMKRGEAFYKPMLELIEFFQKNDFIIYISTATERFTSRAIIEGHIDIPNSHIIRTETKIITSNQKSTDPIGYIFQKNDTLIFNGTLIGKNNNFNKMISIIKEIGKVPVLSMAILIQIQVWLIMLYQIKVIKEWHLCCYVMILLEKMEI